MKPRISPFQRRVAGALLALSSLAFCSPTLAFDEPVFVPLSPAKSGSGGLDAATSRLDIRSGVALSWNSAEAIFPQAKKYAMSAEPIAETERERALKIVGAALARYPASLLANNLKAVFLVRALHFSGVSTGGTYGADRVYLADGGDRTRYTDTWMTQVFHCEFSSVLLWRHPDCFDETAWKACNAPDFRYGSGGVDAVKTGAASTQLSTQWWRQGFLHRYATSSIEEDFNSMVGYLFTHAPNKRPALGESAALEQKAALVKGFYARLGMDIDAADGVLAAKPQVAARK